MSLSPALLAAPSEASAGPIAQATHELGDESEVVIIDPDRPGERLTPEQAERVQVEHREATAPKRSARGPREANTGFHMDFRVGARIPMGKATQDNGDALAKRYAWQIPFSLVAGGKLSPNFFLGGYLLLAFGDEGSDNRVQSLCREEGQNFRNDVACSVLSVEVGALGTYYFSPDDFWNPWVSYGIGWGATTQDLEIRTGNYTESTTARGLTVAKIGFGVDYRAAVGFGPFVEASVGRFTQTSTQINNTRTHSASIDDPAFHTWLTLGMRLVLNP